MDVENFDQQIRELLEVPIATLNKPVLLEKCQEFQKALKRLHDQKSQPSPESNLDEVIKRLCALEKNDVANSNEIAALKRENSTLKKRVKDLEKDLDDNENRFIEIEKSVTGVEQYTRRENFEISGIPLNVKPEELKNKVIDIVNSITDRTEDDDNLITPKDIHACHRLKEENGKANVIIRMVNREDTISILKAKKKLPPKSEDFGYTDKLYINENLCSNNKTMYEEARKLKKNGLIHSYWTFNGVVHIKKNEREQYGKKILHLADFEDHFTLSQLGWE